MAQIAKNETNGIGLFISTPTLLMIAAAAWLVHTSGGQTLVLGLALVFPVLGSMLVVDRTKLTDAQRIGFLLAGFVCSFLVVPFILVAVHRHDLIQRVIAAFMALASVWVPYSCAKIDSLPQTVSSN